MKKIILFFGLVFIASLSCKKKNPVDGVEKIIDISFSKTSVSYQFVDAKTGEQLDLDGNRVITTSFTGKNATDVVDNFGGSQIGADYGMMAVTLAEGVIPSTTNQVVFTLHAETSGYLPVSKTTVILQEGHQHFIVEMINISDAPTGMSISQDIISAVPSTGITSSVFTLSPSASVISGTTASVTIPSGTTLMDKNSVAVSGNITTTLAYSNPNEEGFSNLFPGSSAVTQLSTGDFVSFKSIGLISMDMVSSTGTEVKNFGSPIQMTMEIPTGTTDIDGDAVVAGNSFGVYSYSEYSGKWTHESDEVVTLNNSTGKLEVNFNMTHLSTWQVADKANTQNDTYYYNQISFSASCPDYFKTQNDIIVELINNDGDIVEKQTAITNPNKPVYLASIHPVYGAAAGAKFKWYKTINPANFIEANGDYNQPPQTVTFPSSWCPIVKEFKILLETNCPGSLTKVKPQCPVFSWAEGGGPMKFIGQMIAGELKTSTANFDLSKKHCLVTFYQNKLVVLTGELATFNFGYRTIDGNDIDLSRELTAIECTYLKAK